MRFAADEWLLGLPFALLIAGVFIAQAWRLQRAQKRFGEPGILQPLTTGRTGARRTVSAVLISLAVAFAGLAAAKPQYGKGTRVLPATNLDIVLVLDYSKSMYARDVSPSRIARAKIEVKRLVRELAGARFAAVAFAGDPLSFPLTSDGAAIAQFFQGLDPNDMPVGGTATARALDAGRRLLNRDPLSDRHEQVMILVTDGEDLEGDPVAAAEASAADGIRLEVVQIGGTSPEPIPKIGDDGRPEGMRRDASGQILTTALSPEGEAQLEEMAQVGGGSVVRAEKGGVGIDTVTSRLRRLMTEELSERVETVYADVYHLPLSIAVLLLVAECFVGTARRQNHAPDPPRKPRRRPAPKRARVASAASALLLLTGCTSFDALFERESPEVNRAIEALESDQPDEATEILTAYLETGPCEAGVIGAGDRAREKGDASFDLGLALGALHRKGVPNGPDPSGTAAPTTPAPGGLPGAGGLGPPQDADAPPAPSPKIECALRLLTPVARHPDHPPALRARAFYLAGNLELERQQFEAAVDFYDQSLVLAPGLPEDAGDPIGRDAAYNRALALRLLQEEREQEQEQKSNQDQQDQQGDQDEDQQQDEQNQEQEGDEEQQGDQDQQDQQDAQDQQDGQDQDEQQDQKGEPQDQGDQQEEDRQGDANRKDQADAADQPDQARQAQRGPSASQEERMLDMLEQAPTLQQHNAEQRARSIRVRPTMEDK